MSTKNCLLGTGWIWRSEILTQVKGGSEHQEKDIGKCNREMHRSHVYKHILGIILYLSDNYDVKNILPDTRKTNHLSCPRYQLLASFRY